ncbi:UNVERIFIED_CONTAM: hypothetical protein Sangu_2506400 [Sesamum angustifolium]|uniref:Reverse transcriptase n=1 Tax=Sesamum angustifolium TaxID=2727405 RepID=A0AAW2JNV3_9LAMI
MMWQQCSKAHWLYDQDRNTQFFHASATSRRRPNRITRIKDAGGRWREDIEGIQETLLEYFHGIFTRSQPLQHELDSVLNTLRPKVTAAINASHLQPFIEQEVSDTIFSMSPIKSPGPDEVFSSMRQEAERRGDILGIAITWEASGVSHLFFVDDIIIFGEAREGAMEAIK